MEMDKARLIPAWFSFSWAAGTTQDPNVALFSGAVSLAKILFLAISLCHPILF